MITVVAVEVFHRRCLHPVTSRASTLRVLWRTNLPADSTRFSQVTNMYSMSVRRHVHWTRENVPVLTFSTSHIIATSMEWILVFADIGLVADLIRGPRTTSPRDTQIPTLGLSRPSHPRLHHLHSSLCCQTTPNLLQFGNGKAKAWSLMMLGSGPLWKNSTWTRAGEDGLTDLGVKSTLGQQRVRRTLGVSAVVMQLMLRIF